jgi:hypothetical protein
MQPLYDREAVRPMTSRSERLLMFYSCSCRDQREPIKYGQWVDFKILHIVALRN